MAVDNQCLSKFCRETECLRLTKQLMAGGDPNNMGNSRILIVPSKLEDSYLYNFHIRVAAFSHTLSP